MMEESYDLKAKFQGFLWDVKDYLSKINTGQ
jgi:hypothetical protein